MTRSPKNSSDGSTPSTPSASTTERSAGQTTQTTTSRSKKKPHGLTGRTGTPRPFTPEQLEETRKTMLAISYVTAWLGHSSVRVTENHYAALDKDALTNRVQAMLRANKRGEKESEGT